MCIGMDADQAPAGADAKCLQQPGFNGAAHRLLISTEN
jgi:hypothetical protein